MWRILNDMINSIIRSWLGSLEAKLLGDRYAESRYRDAAIIKTQYDYVATSRIGILDTSSYERKKPSGDVPRTEFNYGQFFTPGSWL